MKLLDLIATANRNLTRSKLRTLLTILAIFVGGFTLTLTTALNTGANEYLQRQLGNVAVPGVFEVVPKTDLNPLNSGEVKEYDPNKKEVSAQQLFNATLDNDDAKKIQKVEGVASATPFYMLQPEYITRSGEKKFQVKELQQDFGLNLDLAPGGAPLKTTDTNKLVLSEEYLSPLNLTDQNVVGQKLTIAYKDILGKLTEKEFTVSGVMRKTFVTSGSIFVDVTSAKEIAEKQGQATRFIAIFAKFKDANDSTDEKALKDRLQASGDYTAISLKERVGTLTTVISAITAALNVVGIIALIAASFGIINTLLMSVYERTKEIGLMKALGMRRGKVFVLFAIEAALVGFWGSLIAVGAATAASFFINSFAASTFLKDFEGFTLLVVNPLGALGVIALIMAIAFVAGTLPALKASRLNPIDALRTE
ncbi:MAG TPA: FtsX-like permease family protein [Candidatus Saccharimonadales bacterium]|nr:FtsX-like permease family protein [Candidatus Saccharimonadales bacterium]